MPSKYVPKQQPVREIVRVGRDWHVKIKLGCITPIVVITAKEFNRMLDDLVESEDVSKSVLEKMTEVCRRNFRKGRVAKRLRPETIQMLKDGYCDHFETTWETICAKDRHSTYIEMRMLVYGHLSTIGYTHAEISVFFIDRHRTSIMSSVDRHNDLCRTEKGFEFKAHLLSEHMQRWMFSDGKQPVAASNDELPIGTRETGIVYRTMPGTHGSMTLETVDGGYID